MPIYDNVRRLVDEQNTSVRKIETRAGLSNGTIRRWNNSMPRVDSIRKVATLLNVTVEDLLSNKS